MSWAEIFDECDIYVKKMIVSQLVHQVNVSRGYDIDIKLNVTIEQYMELADYDFSANRQLAS